MTAERVGAGVSKVDRKTKYLVTDEQLDGLHQDMIGAGIPSALATTLTGLMVSEHVTDAWCPKCNGAVKVRYPDWRGYTQIVGVILNYLLGKPVEKKRIDVTHRLLQRRGELEALSDEELLQVEAGEWTPPKS